MDYFKPFLVQIAGRAREGDHTSAHDQIIAPLLQNALAAYVYNGRKDSIVGAFGSVEHPLNLSDFIFLVRERGKFRLDLARECVNGAEISIDQTPNMGNSLAATKLAKRAMSEG